LEPFTTKKGESEALFRVDCVANAFFASVL